MPPNKISATRQNTKKHCYCNAHDTFCISCFLYIYISATNLYDSLSGFWQVSCVESFVGLCWFTDVAEYMDEHSRGRSVVVCWPHAVFTFSFWHWTVFPNWMISCLATICALQYKHEWIRMLFIHMTLGISNDYTFLSPILLLTS